MTTEITNIKKPTATSTLITAICGLLAQPLILSLFFFMASESTVVSEDTPPRHPQLWYEDNNLGQGAGVPADFRDKFLRPETWTDSRHALNVYEIRLNTLMNQDNRIDDDFLKNHLIPVLNDAGVSIALDVGTATWLQTHENKKDLLERDATFIGKLRGMKANVTHLSLQSVLSKPLQQNGDEVPYEMEKRIEDVVEYMSYMDKQAGNLRIGIIDALPSKGKAYRDPYRNLVAALNRKGLRLDHIHLDIPVEIVEQSWKGISWQKVREVEVYVRDLNANFGLVCTSGEAGNRSDEAWHQAVLRAQRDYRKAGGDPDHWLIMSWFPYPKTTIPETAPDPRYPAMKTVLLFARQLAQKEELSPE